MKQCTSRFVLVITIASLGLSGCTAVGENNPSASNGGSIELALSEACNEGSDPLCISVGNQRVMRPSDFEEAIVENATVSSDNQQNAVEITFTEKGAKIINNLTTQASDAGTESRLLVKIGDEIVAAVSVKGALSGDQVTLALAPEDDPEAVIERIQGG